MNRTFRQTVAIAGLISPLAGGAEAQERSRLTLDEALALFALNSLELGIARAEAAEATALARQAAAYPNLTLTGTHEPLSDGDATYHERYLNLSQRLEWPGARAARRGAAEQRATAARARFAADSARLVFEVKRTYAEAARAERAEQMLERVTSVLRLGERQAEERHREEDIALYDLRRIRIERVRYETLLAEGVLQSAEARRTLALMVVPEAEDPEVAPVDLLGTLPPTVEPEAAVDAALARRPEMFAAVAALESARRSASAARGDRIPEVTATGGYKTQSDGFAGAFLGLSLPLPLWDRRGGAIQAAEARVAAAEARSALARRQVEDDVRRAVETYASLSRRVELLDVVPTEAGDLLTIAQIAYAEGEMELIDVLDAADALKDAHLADTRLRADLWTAYYDLERAIGGFGGSTNDGGQR